MEENLPQLTEAENTALEMKANQLRVKVLELVSDSLEVLHSAVLNKDFRGKKVSRTQVYAASPIVSRFAPQIQDNGTGNVHLHLNIPRPGVKKVEGKVIEQSS